MVEKRKIEIFSAGCAASIEVIEMVRRAAGQSDEVTVHDMKDINVAERAKSLGIRSVPSVVVGGITADIVTVDNSLVQQLKVDRHTGAITYEN